MSSDELRAWLLLAGFDHRWRKPPHRYIRIHYNDYIIVDFLMAGRIEVATLEGKRWFIRRRTAQQYIQELMENHQ